MAYDMLLLRLTRNWNFLSCSKPYCSKSATENLCGRSWDIVVSGGGMVGCAAACLLGSSPILSNKRILLLESSKSMDYPIDPMKYSNRVSAISPSSKKLFEKLGVWDKIINIRAKEVKKMQVWEACSSARISFQHPNMCAEIAYIIENNVILQALSDCLNNLPNEVHVKVGTNAVEYNLPNVENYSGEEVSIKLKDGQCLKTKILIGADGANSLVRKTMGTKYIGWHYNQKGIVATLKLSEHTENNVAWQRFLSTGPLAILPLSDELSSLVWTVPSSMSDKLLKMTDDEFVDSLNSYLWSDKYKSPLADSVLSTCTEIVHKLFSVPNSVHQLPPNIFSVEPGSRAAFPLALGHAVEYVSPRVALVGDAAHRIHPLAGQGVNLGFGDVSCLVEHLESSAYQGDKIGTWSTLLDYEVQRQRHVVPIMAAIDAFYRLYSSEFPPVVILRSLGLNLVDSMESIKGRIIKFASS